MSLQGVKKTDEGKKGQVTVHSKPSVFLMLDLSAAFDMNTVGAQGIERSHASSCPGELICRRFFNYDLI